MEDVCRDIAEHFLLRLENPRVKFITVALDWTQVAGFDVLTAAIPIRGRAQPIFFKVWLASEVSGFMTALEKELVEQMLSVVPKQLRCKVVFVADRGFAKVELFKHIQDLGARYVIRLPRGIYVVLGAEERVIEQVAVSEGEQKFFPEAVLTRDDPHPCTFLTMRLHHWEMKHKEDDLLMFASNLQEAQEIVAAYRKRPKIEAMFKDCKRRGLKLEQMLIRTVESARKMLLAVFLYYLFVVVLALTGLPPEFLRRIQRHGSRAKLSVFHMGDKFLQALLFEPDPQGLSFFRGAWCLKK